MNSQFKESVNKIVLQIPSGRVMTYGQIAAMCGSPGAARAVGQIAHFGQLNLPWHRVVNTRGVLAIGFVPGGRASQAQMLEDEGVKIAGGYKIIKLDQYFWKPENKLDLRKIPGSSELFRSDTTSFSTVNVPMGTPPTDKTTPVLSEMGSEQAEVLRKSSKIKLLVIVGPTASGKTRLAIDIAKKYNGEIISADSRAVYKGLDIGTAKPTLAERRGVVHYGIDIIKPDQKYSAADFVQLAQEKTRYISSKNRLPIIVGGTGLYVDAFLYDFKLSTPDLSKYQQLEKLTIDELQNHIVDNGYNMPINYKNKLHLISTIIRAGVEPQRSHVLPVGSVIVGIMPEQNVIKQNINIRCSYMLEKGVCDEYLQAIRLYGSSAPGLNGGIYKVLNRYYIDQISEQDIKQAVITSDYRLAKRQITWFKRNKDIVWFDNTDNAKSWLAGKL